MVLSFCLKYNSPVLNSEVFFSLQFFQKIFSGIIGFAPHNDFRMKGLYLIYFESPKLTTLSSEISWSHIVAILAKYKELLERDGAEMFLKPFSIKAPFVDVL